MVGGLHPDLVGREEVQVPGDAAGVRLRMSVILTLLLLAIPPGSKTENTSNNSAGSGQDVSLVVVTDQVVAGCLPGGVEPGQRHTEVGGAEDSVHGAGQRLTVERPEQRAGVDAEVGVDPAAGGQRGPHAQDGVLGIDNCYIWRRWMKTVDEHSRKVTRK
ncbi:hypothetical protein F7725_008215, partial [Dissostichus mawsoni]